MPSFNLNGNELNFKPVTRREQYQNFDKQPTQKPARQGFIPYWQLKVGKLSIGTQLQLDINECINTNTFPFILKEAYFTPINKESEKHNPKNYQPFLQVQH